MKVLFDMGHPADVHLFKYTIRNLEGKNHDIKICVRERENIVKNLLNLYDFDHDLLEKNVPGLANKAVTMFKNDYKLLKISRKFNPDIFISLASPYSAQVSRILKKSSITFTDSEPSLNLALTVPFTDAIITPSGFSKNLGKKHLRIDGYKETAYLHPNRFIPNFDILNILNVSRGEKYVILRFSAFDASHDLGVKGFSLEYKRKLVKKLKEFSRVFISSELKLPEDLEKFSINIPEHMMHDALYFATLLIGDTQTSTTEAACLGTPAIRCNSFVGPRDMSNFIELEKKYKLIFNFNNPAEALEMALKIQQHPNIKKEWMIKKDNLYKDKIDLTAFMTWFIEKYPGSFRIMKENPSFQERFR